MKWKTQVFLCRYIDSRVGKGMIIEGYYAHDCFARIAIYEKSTWTI